VVSWPFAHADRVGTTFMVTDENGNVVQDELHYPWGQEWTMVGTMEEERFARLNHRDSETSLDPTHFRMYASGQGRWLSPDPVRACPLHPQNFDRYAYVGNSPTNRTDPHGDAVYPGFDYPYIDYGYGYYPPGYGYDEFDYLINFGVVPDSPPYGYPPYYAYFGFRFGGFGILSYQRTCHCTKQTDYPIQEGSTRGCLFSCECSDAFEGYAIFTVAQMMPKCGSVVEYECPPAVDTVETANVLEELFLPISIGEPTITGCTPP
jgi:RHS repeat-associated protein